MRHGRGSWLARVGAPLLAAGVLAGCSSGTGSGGEDGPIMLRISTFGNMGYEPLIKDYERAHPGVDVKLSQQELNAHHEQLARHLAAGSGAADIVAIEVGFINQFKGQPENFHNLLDFGAGKREGKYLDWKWQQSMAPGGNYQIGLGTDIGGLAMCYRRDLFKQAGLPTDRDEVSRLWPTWAEYIQVGQQFESSDVDAHWVDSATNIFNPVLRQQDKGFFNRQDELIMAENPGVKKAWEVTMGILEADESANLTAFQPEWATGFRKSGFATVICPAWMMAYIKDTAPDTKGKWDIADVPGDGGNWGGSFLTIPKQTEHAQEAYELASWLTAPEQQLRLFKTDGLLPSYPELYDNPAVKNYKDPFFNNAPVGEIFTESAREFEQQYQGVLQGPVRQAVENVIRQVANGRISTQEGWQNAVETAKREVS